MDNFSKIISPILPFVSERIYQSLNGNKNSVHLEEYPKFKSKKTEKKLLENMENIREIISSGLKTRDKLQIGLKWPLAEAKIIADKKISKEFQKIIADQLNVKKLEIKSGNELSVNFDTIMTPELEAEGYAREISRKIQAFRKDLGFEKKQVIELQIVVGKDEQFKKILEMKKEFIKERTNTKRLSIVTTEKERFKKNIEFEIKDKKGIIGITEINPKNTTNR